MIRSKDIADYVESAIGTLKVGESLPFDLHLYFPQNKHVIVWLRAGFPVTDEFLRRYTARGLQTVWVHRDDQPKAEERKQQVASEVPQPPATDAPVAPTPAVEAAAPAEAPTATLLSQELVQPLQPSPTPLQKAPDEPPIAPLEPAPPPALTQGQEISALLKSETLEKKKKTALVAKSARQVIHDAVNAPPPVELAKKEPDLSRQVVRDILEQLPGKARDLAQEIWNLSDQAPEIEHGVNVATYAVLLALAFGRIDEALIADLALAGLLHDVGVSQLPVQVTSTPWRKLAPADLKRYQAHVPLGLDLIQALAPQTPERVRFLIAQHQEKFDGTGYPKRLEGFHIDGVAQLLAIAEVLETFVSGMWDGKTRTYREALDELEKLDKARTFPEFFNPEILSAVLRWTRSADADDKVQLARKTVEDRAKGLINQRQAS